MQTLFVCSLFRFDGFVYRHEHVCALYVWFLLSMLVALLIRTCLVLCDYAMCVYVCICECVSCLYVRMRARTIGIAFAGSFFSLDDFERYKTNERVKERARPRPKEYTTYIPLENTYTFQFICHLKFKRYISLLYEKNDEAILLNTRIF